MNKFKILKNTEDQPNKLLPGKEYKQKISRLHWKLNINHYKNKNIWIKIKKNKIMMNFIQQVIN